VRTFCSDFDKSYKLTLIYFTSELAGNKSIYIITGVMKAAVTAVITNDKDSTEKIPVGSQPIAFS